MGLIQFKITLKEFAKFIKDNGLRGVIILLLLLAIGFGGGYFVKNINISIDVGDDNSGQYFTGSVGTVINPSPAETSDPDSCKEKNFEDHLNDWEIKNYKKPDKDGFYCLRFSSAFLFSEIWYNSLIPTKFKSIEIRYKLKNKNEDNDSPPSFIFAVGKDPKILRFFAPEKNPQLVGFQKIDISKPGQPLVREEPKELEEPMQYGVETEAKVRIVVNETNKVTFHFNLAYISAKDGDSVKDNLSYDVDLLDPKPDSQHSKLKVGFGTFRESCVKPISYKICY